MMKDYPIKTLPINDLFKDNQKPVYLFNLDLNYKELMQNHGLDYDIWEESEGFMIGKAIEIKKYKYLLKAVLNHSIKNSLVAVYVLTETQYLKHATEQFIETFCFSINDIKKI